MARWFRVRLPYLALVAAALAVGLAVHFHGHSLPPATRDILGDAVWAVMITGWVAVVTPAMRLPARAAIALAICFLVELSQLYYAPGIEAVRVMTVGHLVLGSDFDPRDLAAYTAGVLTAMLIERAIRSAARST
ncbi:MAG TPA: DUF2809 domain-containing protein [Longimicrobiales bacterium]|nr:DUF2809 domain-containing protein [Longimicrobiales bacterium]